MAQENSLIDMNWKESLARQTSTLSHLLTLDTLNGDIAKLLAIEKSVTGFNYFAGVGKNMFVAARVAATFDSLGIRSMYVDPVNTLHGSMGIFSQSDIVIAISKSGETEELNRFLQALRERNFNRIIAVTSNKSSSLARAAMLTIYVPVLEEGDHLGLAPIASTMLFSAVLDAIAVQLSSERGYSRLDFIRNHPGGSLGRTVA